MNIGVGILRRRHHTLEYQHRMQGQCSLPGYHIPNTNFRQHSRFLNTKNGNYSQYRSEQNSHFSIKLKDKPKTRCAHYSTQILASKPLYSNKSNCPQAKSKNIQSKHHEGRKQNGSKPTTDT